jgi:ornithine cyclodeaminase/alanine dehydrogenase-like protein (mu-crystallin family)
VLGAADVDALVPLEECIRSVEDAFRRWALGEVRAPGVLGIHVEGGGFHIKAAAMDVAGRSYFCAKTNGNFPANPARHALPSIQGIIVLCDGRVGTPLAILDSMRLTELRTAAATAVAARYLAREDAGSVTLIGCGAQAATQLRALNLVRPLTRVLLLDRDPEQARRLAAGLVGELGGVLEVASSLADALAESDMCVTCTTSTEPILERDLVRAGTFVAAVGADSPVKHEVGVGLLAASKVVADSLEQCLTIGDLHHAVVSGAMRREDVHAELGQVVAGILPGRERDEEIIVFDSTGTALQDVAAAAIAFERASAEDRGLLVDLAPVA